jgi:hypothetical protein
MLIKEKFLRERIRAEILRLKTAVPSAKNLREGIVHIEDMKPEQLLKFFDSWSTQKDKIGVTEKIDGSPMVFGVNEGGEFFLGSKNLTFTSYDKIPKVFFMDHFRKFFINIEKLPVKDVVNKALGEDIGGFTIEGEAVPHHQHNLISYSEKKVGEGVFVIFNIKSETKNINDNDSIVKISQALNAANDSGIKFMSVPEISRKDISFEEIGVEELRDLILQHGNVLAKPARSPEEKAIKRLVADKANEIGKLAKSKMLSGDVTSAIGDKVGEIEGIVVRLPDNSLVKFIDKDYFTKRGAVLWSYLKKVMAFEKQFKQEIKENPGGFASALKKFESSLLQTKKEFESGGRESIGVGKQVENTEKQIEYQLNLINAMKKLPQEEAISKYLDRTLAEAKKRKSFLQTLIEDKKSANKNQFLILEGGHAVKSTNTETPRELVEPTVKNAIKTCLGDIEFSLIGNLNKAVSSDIDVAIDAGKLLQEFGLQTVDTAFFSKVKEKIQKNSPQTEVAILSGLKIVSFSAPLVDQSGKQLASISNPDEPGVVQIDLFFGNVNFMKKSKSGAPADSKYKAVYRNLLISEIAANVTEEIEPGVFRKYELGGNEGILENIFRLDAKGKREVIAKKLISRNADDIPRMFINDTLSWSDIDSFEKTLAQMKSPKFKHRDKLELILSKYTENLTRLKLEVPRELSNDN